MKDCISICIRYIFGENSIIFYTKQAYYLLFLAAIMSIIKLKIKLCDLPKGFQRE